MIPQPFNFALHQVPEKAGAVIFEYAPQDSLLLWLQPIVGYLSQIFSLYLPCPPLYRIMHAGHLVGIVVAAISLNLYWPKPFLQFICHFAYPFLHITCKGIHG
ncbi:MAG: hypothetical protein M1388_01170 [Thaumarchaeota archaeon]|nr:hypothetical protein [Nitrososphaerota archaeon]